MAMTPTDIHHKEFKSARFGGYNEEEVDAFLDLVADEFERLGQESAELRQQMEHMKKRLSEFEEMQTSLQSALLAASKSAEAVKEQARQESEAMLSKAQEESDSMMRSAQEQARQMLLAAQNDRQKAERAIASLQEIKKRYLDSIREISEAQLAKVADWESREETDGVKFEQPTSEPPGFATGSDAPAARPEKKPQDAPREARTLEALLADQPSPAPARAETAAPPTVAAAPREEPSAPPDRPEPAVAPPPPAAVAPPENASGKEGPRVPPEDDALQRAPAAREMREVAPPVKPPERAVQEPRGPEDKVAPPPSRDLVDEVLAMGAADESVFGEFDVEEEGDDREKRRRGRKDKRDGHFFWE